MIADDKLQEILKLAATATPGPWGVNMGDIGTLTDAGEGYPLDFYTDSKEVVAARECHCGATGRLQINGADLSYIAACSPDGISELVTELLAARAAVERLERFYESTCPKCDNNNRDCACKS